MVLVQGYGLWADQLRKITDKWEPSDYSVLCSKHFKGHCFEQDSILSDSMALGKRKACLKSDAGPSIFEKPRLKRFMNLKHPYQRRAEVPLRNVRANISSYYIEYT